MKLLLVVAALLICGTQGMTMRSECPGHELSFHAGYTGASRGVNKLSSGEPRFGLNSEIYEVYEPGKTYEFEIGQSEEFDEVKHFYLVSSPVKNEPSACPSLGSWQQPSLGGSAPREEGCEHVLEGRGDELETSFVWTAPDCGCVTIIAVVVNQAREFFTDDEHTLQGPLTMTLCPTEEDEALPSLYDQDFYGIDEDGEVDAFDQILDEVTDIMTGSEEDEEEEEKEEDVTEEEGEEEVPAGRGRGRGRGKGRGRPGKGKGRGMRKNEDQNEDQEDGDEDTTRRGRKHRIAKMWKKKMGRRNKDNSKGIAKKTARLEKVCTTIREKGDDLKHSRSPKKSLLTEEALQTRRERWATFRQDALVCCDDTEEDRDMVACFSDAHGRRLAEKLCGASGSDFKSGEMPERIEAAQEKCCEAEGEEKKECLMDSIKVLKKLRKEKKRNAAAGDRQAKVTAICARVERKPVPPRRKLSKLSVVQSNKWTALFTERRLQISECCKLAEEEEQEACLKDLHEQRFDRVCQGEEELSPPWSKKSKSVEPITDACCVLEGTERYECFGEKMSSIHPRRRGHRGHHQGRHRGHHRRGPGGDRDADADDILDEDDEVVMEEDGKRGRRPGRKMMGKRGRGMRQRARKHGRVCCQGGRKAGTLLELDVAGASKWKTCQQEGRGFIVDREEAGSEAASQGLCINSFRKCCMKSVIRQAREEAVEKAKEEEEEEAEM